VGNGFPVGRSHHNEGDPEKTLGDLRQAAATKRGNHRRNDGKAILGDIRLER
jgi:hypothetical protein